MKTKEIFLGIKKPIGGYLHKSLYPQSSHTDVM